MTQILIELHKTLVYRAAMEYGNAEDAIGSGHNETYYEGRADGLSEAAKLVKELLSDTATVQPPSS